MKRFLPLAFSLMFVTFGAHLAEAQDKYFPDGVWGPPQADTVWSEAEQNQHYEESFGGALFALREKPLWVERSDAEATMSMRMLVFPSWEGTLMVRLEVAPDGRMNFLFKELSGDGTHKNQRIVTRRKGAVAPDLATTIAQIVAEIDPMTSKTPSQGGAGGLDGTTVVFEFSGQGKFNALTRWEEGMGKHDPLIRLKNLLLDIAFDR